MQLPPSAVKPRPSPAALKASRLYKAGNLLSAPTTVPSNGKASALYRDTPYLGDDNPAPIARQIADISAGKGIQTERTRVKMPAV
jgi:hypothetical protein